MSWNPDTSIPGQVAWLNKLSDRVQIDRTISLHLSTILSDLPADYSCFTALDLASSLWFHWPMAFTIIMVRPSRPSRLGAVTCRYFIICRLFFITSSKEHWLMHMSKLPHPIFNSLQMICLLLALDHRNTSLQWTMINNLGKTSSKVKKKKMLEPVSPPFHPGSFHNPSKEVRWSGACYIDYLNN